MNVEWTPQARSAVIETMIYIEETFGTKTMLEFAEAIAESEMYLARDPYMFKIEPLLEGCAGTFRGLNVKKKSTKLSIVLIIIVFILSIFGIFV